MLLTVGAYNSRVVLLHGAWEYALFCRIRRHHDSNLFRLLVQVSPWHKQCNTYNTCECRSPSDSTDTSQWKCHNCSCGKKAVENFRRYQARIRSLPTEGPRKYFLTVKWLYTTALLTHISFQTIFFYNYFSVITSSASFFIWYFASFDVEIYLAN